MRDGESYTKVQRRQRRNVPASPGPTLQWASGVSHWLIPTGSRKLGNPVIQSCRAASQVQSSTKDGFGGLNREHPVQLLSSIVKAQHIAMPVSKKGSQRQASHLSAPSPHSMTPNKPEYDKGVCRPLC